LAINLVTFPYEENGQQNEAKKPSFDTPHIPLLSILLICYKRIILSKQSRRNKPIIRFLRSPTKTPHIEYDATVARGFDEASGLSPTMLHHSGMTVSCFAFGQVL